MQNVWNQIQWILQEKHGGKMTSAAKEDIARLKAGEPVDYIIGFVEFLGSNIDLSKRPLIPRMETEFWVEKAINELKVNSKLKVLDMFSGSGCIGIAALKYLKGSHVIFVDSEKNAIQQIKMNNKKIHGKRYRVIRSDLFEHVPKGHAFDVIFANPPYIPMQRKNKVQKSVTAYEPRAALFGKGDGLFYIKKFLQQAKQFLVPGGKIYMEFDPVQKPAIAGLLEKYGYHHWEFRKDQFNRWRYVVVENENMVQ